MIYRRVHDLVYLKHLVEMRGIWQASMAHCIECECDRPFARAGKSARHPMGSRAAL